MPCEVGPTHRTLTHRHPGSEAGADADASNVAIAVALTIGCRLLGTRTPGPSPMRVVRSAQRARIIHTFG